MSRKNIENIYSLSPMQEGILFHALTSEEVGVYFVQLSWTLAGKLDVAAFERAWQLVVDRHPVLRTSFVWERLDKPVQVVKKKVTLPFERRDLSALSASEQEAAIARIEEEDRARGFDLTKAPILRVTLLDLGPELHRFVWGTHHLVLDGWSLPLILNEVFTAYAALSGGKEPALERRKPYGDYIAWLKKQDRDKAEAYWKNKLAGFSAPTPFRVDRPAAGAWSAGERSLVLEEGPSAELVAFARKVQITTSTLVQGAWTILLARLSGEEDVLYGSTVSGRSAPVPGIEGMIGMFINTLPIRARVAMDAPAIEYLRALQNEHAEARDYEYSALVDIQGWSEVPRGTPLFESQVAFENTPEEERRASAGLTITAGGMFSQTHFPLTIVASLRKRLFVRMRYDERRFDGAVVERMLDQLRAVLEGVARDPSVPIGRIPLLGEAERAAAIAASKTPTIPSQAEETTLHAMFEAVADRTPDAIAVVAGDERVTFRDLDARANKLARHLRARGAGPDAIIGICLPRSASWIVALLATLKAGGAYVPLDPAYPPKRIADLASEAGAVAIVTTASIAETLADVKRTIVRLDADKAVIDAEASDRLGATSSPSNLAYVLFTSGSTGKPKGVAIEHRNLASYVRGVGHRLALPEGARYAHVSTFSADLGNTVLFPPLCLGGALHVIAEELVTDPDGIGEYFTREGIDCLKIVPSHLSALLSGQRPEQVIPKALLVLGGEASSWELIGRIEALSPSCRVMNHYGPTETTVGVLTFPVTRGERVPETSIMPLGRPLPGSHVYVLDGAMSPLPIGVPGEVYIGGAQVARGYLGRPDLTRERFVPDPFSSEAGATLYKTGDRAKVLPSGDVLFLGRADFQVKIRGYRIELGEIEAALAAIPGVKDAVVLALETEGKPGDKTLAGYAVPAPGALIDAAELRAALEATLPAYMVPAVFVVLEALPLTPNGKIDRRALAALAETEKGDAGAAAEHVAPRTPIEEVLASIWCDVFERERVSVHERFADLGGHSLLAIQIIARVREAFQIDIPIRSIFEAPTIALLADVVSEAVREGEGLKAPPIERVPRTGPLVPSFAQERLFFLDQLEPNSPFYNVPSALEIKGPLNRDALVRALRAIVRRHEVLRTTFTEVDGRPMQVVHDDMELDVPLLDLSALPAAERAQKLADEMAAEARRPFDLRRGPLVRAEIVILSDEEHMLLTTLHHIVSDGWTRGILNREIQALYAAFVDDKPSPLPELAIHYADYAAWQKGWLTGEVLDRQIAYWKRQLEGAPQAIELPTDKPRPAVQRFRGARAHVMLSKEASRALKDLCRREGVTLFMVLLGALDVLLHRWTGQDDVVVGTSVTNRSRLETDKIIGFFINALVLRVSLGDDPTFSDLLQRVRETCLGAYAHEDMPFERLVQEIAPEPDPSRAPLFQVIFTMLNPPAEPLRLPGLSLAWKATDSATVKYDLTFLMGESPRGLVAVIDYNVDLFEAATIDRMLGHLKNVLEAVGKDAGRKVSALPMVGEAELDALRAFARTKAEEAAEECVHDLFEATADRTPDAIALVAGADRLSFRELDARSNRVAHALRARGVEQGSIVGLLLGRSADVVIALLGILKAGGAYVPIDPSYPKARVSEIVSDAGAAAVVTLAPLRALVPEGVPLLLLDADEAEIARASAARPEVDPSASDLAYVLFTSGSTGKPKGVAIEHRQLVSYVRGVATRLALPEGSSYAHVSTFSADLGNTVLFPPLCLGGTLHVIAEELTTDPVGIAEYFDREKIDCLKIVPSHLGALLAAPKPERVLPEKLLVLGGEASSWDLIARIEALKPGCRVMNHYGPTETTVGVLTFPVTRGERVSGTAIMPLGRPIPGSSVYVLDRAMKPAPIGVPGEVYIGGAQVARGYLHRPELTTERFVPDPFSDRADARLYKTGDRAKVLSTGDVLFLGRVDFQVKIRGYRIELGEVEAALRALGNVADAVVIAEDDGATKRLVGYVVPKERRSQAAPDVTSLRADLGERLPEQMIPSVLVVLEALPLTPNGKIDRRALSAMASRVEEQASADDGPKTPVEEVLASIWCDVFERDRVGVHERFSDLGGHSLLAIQIVARAREAFAIELPLRAIFEAPTIAALAERVEAARSEEEGALPLAPPVTRVDRAGEIALSFGQERLFFLDKIEPDSAFYNVPSGQRIRGPLDVASLERALAEVTHRHEVLRTTFAEVDGKPTAVIHDEGAPLAFDDISAEPDPEAALRARASAEAKTPFRLSRGPLVRASLLRVAKDDHALLVTMHHVVADAWTKGIFYRELFALYDAFRRGEPSPLPELSIQYADYAAWQRANVGGDRMQGLVAYWKKQLEGAPHAIEIVPDRPRPAVESHRGARTLFHVPEETGRAMKELSRREGATLFMTLLASFAALLDKHTGQGDVVIGTPAAGRARREIEGLIGFFINTIALRVRTDDDPTFVDLMQRAREVCLGGYAHEDMPFERLVQEVAPARDLSRQPIFQVIFTLQDAPEDARSAAGLAATPIGAQSATSKVDLTMGIIRKGEALIGVLEYATDLFDAATIDRVIARYLRLLASIAEDPSRRLSDLDALPEAERDALARFNDTAAPYPKDALVQDLITPHVTASPRAIAVRDGERTISYAELDRRARRLARRLRARGVGPDVIAGICLDRTIELAIAILAVLRAGGAYLPIDPSYPKDRVDFMIGDAAPAVTITRRKLREALPAAADLLFVDADDTTLDDGAGDEIACDATPESLAYVIYTSGSTGTPKGVMVHHRGVVNYLVWAIRTYGIAEGSGAPVHSPVSFDLTVTSLLGTLAAGRTVVMIPEGREIDDLAAAMQKGGSSVVKITPAHLDLVTPLIPANRLKGAARALVIGGEALAWSTVAPWREHAPGVALINEYGPTETVVGCAVYDARQGEAALPTATVPIGKPIANTQIHVLDAHQKPAPIGVRGEIYIGGDGVTRGYLNRPALTAERFVTIDVGRDSASAGRSISGLGRLYRTGDFARWLPDGNLDFFGRADDQVKIRGYRIELGEIEAALAAHPAVREGVVVARADEGAAHKRLVAYIVVNDASNVTVEDLRSVLQQKLPDYMVPSAFVLLDKLPLSPTGKVDRRALPAPDEADRVEAGAAFIAPRTAIERSLAAIWASVLRLDEVSVFDNFFAIGGDSILSIQIVARAQREGLVILPRQIFSHQTIAELAGVVRYARAVDADQGAITGPVPLLPAPRWWLDRDPADASHYNQAQIFTAAERLDVSVLDRALAALVAHHDALRLRVARGENGAWTALIAEPPGVDLALVVDLSHVADADLAASIEGVANEAQRSLDIANGPIVRAVLFEAGPERPQRLLLVIHHLAVDGVSWRILTEDLWTAYDALRRGAPTSLPPKTTSIKRWAERLDERARSPEVAAQAAFYRAIGAGPAILCDHDRGDNDEASAKHVVVALDEGETSALLRELPEAYRTQINDALLTALAGALSPMTGATKIVVALEGHGREELFDDVDLSRTAGWFTAIYPVAIDPGDRARGPGEALKAVKEQLRAVPDRGLGYGLLRYFAGDLRDLTEPEVSFNYLGQLDAALPESAPLRRARESAGSSHSAAQRRRFLLDVVAHVLHKRLTLRITYSERRHARATIEGLAGRFLGEIRALVAHARAPGAGGATPSDFALAAITQAQIDELTRRDPRGEKNLDDVYPLSPTQEGILFHTLYDEGATYITQSCWTVDGGLDPALFARAFDAAASRHTLLRTAFVVEGMDRPLQVVRKVAPVPVTIVDLSDRSVDEASAEITRFEAADRARPFVLAEAPLMRVALFRVPGGGVRVVWTRHHLILDGWSTPAFMREVYGLYARAARGEDLRSEPAIPYRAFIAWLAAKDPERERAFFKEELGGVSAPTPLGIDRAAASRGVPRETSERQIAFTESESAAIAAFARKYKITVNTLLLGAWSILLSRYSGERDVVLGVTLSGRSAPIPGVDRMIGLFINTLPVRVPVEPEMGTAKFLAELQEHEAELREHEHASLAAAQALSAVPRGTPLFESLFVFENYPVEASPQAGLSALSARDGRTTEGPPYPLTILAAHRRAINVRVAYERARFDDGSIERMCAHLRTLIATIARDPARLVGDLDPMPDAERSLVLRGFNDTTVAYDPDAMIHELIQAQVDKTPDLPAITFEGETLSYRALDARSSKLAHALRARGVGPDVLVGVCLDRSIEMVVALHGVLKAGGAYVPLDPSYPRDRLAFMLEDASPRVILSSASASAALPPSGAEIVLLDRAWPEIDKNPSERLDRGALAPHHLAYVIYTSGSTGRPKGAMNEHRGIANRLLWMQSAYGIGPGDRVLQKTPFSFDVSVWELFWPFMFGACLVMARPEGHKDTAYLRDVIVEQKITTLHFVPSMLKAFLEEDGIERCASIRKVMASGEALSPDLVDRFFARLGASGAELHNLYGPTEAAVDVTAWAAKPGAPSVPIGKPIHNVRIYIAGDRMMPAPVGVRGELYIGGVQVARGYLNRPALTEERFVPDPFAPEGSGARLYKTGDVARWTPDGQIEYLGRADFQVKLRGFRIELGEIEAALEEHDRVRDAAVMVREDVPGQKRLIAYLVTTEGQKLSVDELRSSLAVRLPDYMIPAAFVLMDELPLTSSGKVDRRALPKPDDAERAELGGDHVAPSGDREEAIAAVWAEVLRVPKVGAHDNFFALGGDSILSIQIVARAHKRGIALTPRQIFEHQTVAELAAAVAASDKRAAPVAEQGPVTGEAPLTPIERWWIDKKLAQPSHWNQVAFLDARERLDPTRLEAAFGALYAHHDALRLRLDRGADGAFAKRLAPPSEGSIPLHVVDLSALPEAEHRRVIDETVDAQHRGLDVAKGPMIRAALFDTGRASRLLIAAHHLVTDGVSWRILLEDLWTAYTIGAEGLPPKTTSIKVWAERLVAHASSDAAFAEAPFWLDERRKGAAAIPVDRRAGENTEGSVRHLAVGLDAAETAKLLREVPQAYKTQINDVLIAAFAEALAGFSLATSALFDLEGHGREELFDDVDTTRTVGWFTSVFPVLIEVGTDPRPGDLLKSVKEQLRAIPSRGAGYGLLRYLSRDAALRDRLAALPASEVSFNYLGQLDQALDVGRDERKQEPPFRAARAESGRARGLDNARQYLIDVNVMVTGGELRAQWSYSDARHERATIEAVARRFLAGLRAIIEHCTSPEAHGATPSDFIGDLSQDAVDMLIELAQDD